MKTMMTTPTKLNKPPQNPLESILEITLLMVTDVNTKVWGEGSVIGNYFSKSIHLFFNPPPLQPKSNHTHTTSVFFRSVGSGWEGFHHLFTPPNHSKVKHKLIY